MLTALTMFFMTILLFPWCMVIEGVRQYLATPEGLQFYYWMSDTFHLGCYNAQATIFALFLFGFAPICILPYKIIGGIYLWFKNRREAKDLYEV